MKHTSAGGMPLEPIEYASTDELAALQLVRLRQTLGSNLTIRELRARPFLQLPALSLYGAQILNFADQFIA